jgi:hypothetical protein
MVGDHGRIGSYPHIETGFNEVRAIECPHHGWRRADQCYSFAKDFLTPDEQWQWRGTLVSEEARISPIVVKMSMRQHCGVKTVRVDGETLEVVSEDAR